MSTDDFRTECSSSSLFNDESAPCGLFIVTPFQTTSPKIELNEPMIWNLKKPDRFDLLRGNKIIRQNIIGALFCSCFKNYALNLSINTFQTTSPKITHPYTDERTHEVAGRHLLTRSPSTSVDIRGYIWKRNKFRSTRVWKLYSFFRHSWIIFNFEFEIK